MLSQHPGAIASMPNRGGPLGISLPPVWVDYPDELVRAGLVRCLDDNGIVVAGESVALVPEPHPRPGLIVVLDLESCDRERVADLAGDAEVSVIAVSSTPDVHHFAAAFGDGPHTLLLRSDMSAATIIISIHAVAAGNRSIPARPLRVLRDPGPRPAEDLFVKRELDVLQMLASGSDTRAIAAALSYSEATVKNTVHDVLVKLGCRTRAHAVAEAVRSGLI
jgi:DNA-binding NarL/FixJ family response regulator